MTRADLRLYAVLLSASLLEAIALASGWLRAVAAIIAQSVRVLHP